MKKEWYKNKYAHLLFHLTGWSLFILIPYLMRPVFILNGRIIKPNFITWENVISYILLAGIFYLNAYLLIPRLLNRNKVFRYVLALLLILAIPIVNSFVIRRPALGFANTRFVASMNGPDMKKESRFLDEPVNKFHISPEMLKENGLPPAVAGARVAFKSPFIPPNILPTFFLVVTVVAISTTYRFMIDRVKLNNIEQERRNEHLKSELTFLRSQISPHFIFNILNSAVSLSRTNSDQLEPTLIKLSSLMRYMLYGADDEKVPLTQEIDYLESYIDLQKLRFGDDVPIKFNRSGALFGYGIEPMLLIPFVENAFKHGVGEINDPSISIDVKVEDGSLHFRVANRFNPNSREIKDPQSGIGLANVKKRLNLLYGENHVLEITENQNLFEVHLKLLLK